jgi:hypothetical protein
VSTVSAGPKKPVYTGTVVRCGSSSFYQAAMPACEVAFKRTSNSLDTDSKEDIVLIVTTTAFHSVYGGTFFGPRPGKTQFVVGQNVAVSPMNGSWHNSMVTTIYYAVHTTFVEKGKEKEELHLAKTSTKKP